MKDKIVHDQPLYQIVVINCWKINIVIGNAFLTVT